MRISDTELENEIIKTMIDHNETIPKVCALICSTDFQEETNARNFDAIKKSYIETRAVDVSKLENFTKYLGEYWASPIHAEKHCRELRDLTKKRSLLRMTESIEKYIDDKDSNWLINSTATALSKIKFSSEPKQTAVKEIAVKVKERWEETKGKTLVGLDTGTKLNQIIFGYQPKHYWVIGAYTNYGKTSFACYLASKFLKLNPLKNLAFFSVEMSSEQIYEKILSQYIGQGIYDIRNNPNKYEDEIEEFDGLHLTIHDDKRTVEDIRLELIYLELQGKKPSVVFVDFLQNMTAQGSEYERMSDITLGLQTLASEMDLCIVALSQVSNDGVKNDSDVIPFKGSGAIAASADLAIQLVRNKKDELEKNLTSTDLDVRIVKNRHGQIKRFYVDLDLTNGVISESIMK